MLLFSGHAARQALALLLGGGMALAGRITAQQLTSFYLYTDFVVAASLSVCDQWGSIMVRAPPGQETECQIWQRGLHCLLVSQIQP